MLLKTAVMAVLVCSIYIGESWGSCVTNLLKFADSTLSHEANQVDIENLAQELLGLSDRLDTFPLRATERAKLSQQLNRYLTQENYDRMRSFVIFLEMLTEEERDYALHNMHQVVSNRYRGVNRRFKRISKIVESHKAQEARAMRFDDEYMLRYERNANGCYASHYTPQKNVGMGRFRNLMFGIGAVTSTWSYSRTHDLALNEEDTNFSSIENSLNSLSNLNDKFGPLGAEIILRYIRSHMSAKVLAANTDSIVRKSLAKYLNSRITSTMDILVFSVLYGVDSDDAEARLNRALAGPNRVQAARELVSYMERERFAIEAKERFRELVTPLKQFVGMDTPDYLGHREVDWNNISDEDLQDPRVLDTLYVAALAATYEEDLAGDYIVSGDVGVDRYAFNAVYALAFLPKDMFVDYYLIYRTICLGALKPEQAYLKALGFFVLNSIVSDQLYFPIRHRIIGQ